MDISEYTKHLEDAQRMAMESGFTEEQALFITMKWPALQAIHKNLNK